MPGGKSRALRWTQPAPQFRSDTTGRLLEAAPHADMQEDPLVMAIRELGVPRGPDEVQKSPRDEAIFLLQVAAEVALGHRCLTAAKALEQEIGNSDSLLADIEAIATEASNLRSQLKVPEVKQILERVVWRKLDALLEAGSGVDERSPVKLEADIRTIERLIAVGDRLRLNLLIRFCQATAKIVSRSASCLTTARSTLGPNCAQNTM